MSTALAVSVRLMSRWVIASPDTLRALLPHAEFQGLAIGVAGEETPPEVAGRVDRPLIGGSEVAAFPGWLDETIPATSP